MMRQNAAKAIFYHELAKMVEAGLGIRESAETLLRSRPAAEVKRMAQRLIDGLAEKHSIADSIQQSSLEQTLLHAGENGGRLGPTLLYLGDTFSLMEKSTRAVLSACLYPALLLHLGLLIGAITTPETFTEGLDPIRAVKTFLVSLVVAYSIIAAVLLGVRSCQKSAESSASMDRLLNHIPLLGSCRKAFAMARFCRVYHTALLAGLPMERTLSLSIDAAQSGELKEARKPLQSTLAEGQALGPIFLEQVPAFPAEFARSYFTAETAGKLDTEMARQAESFQELAEEKTQSLSNWIPKIFYALIVCYVGWRILSFALGYYEMLDSIL